jgi:DNA-binding LacI/PurR family transcriptional regulator
MDAAGLPQRLIHIKQHGRIDGWCAVAEYLCQGERPDALFCQNDQVAEGCYRALREAGLRIPEDVAVIGCDGISQDEFVNPPLATIAQPAEEMCRVAWDFLKKRIANREIPRQSASIEALFVRRPSC